MTPDRVVIKSRTSAAIHHLVKTCSIESTTHRVELLTLRLRDNFRTRVIYAGV